MRKYVLYVLCMALMGTACHKKSSYWLMKETKEFFSFPADSYWILAKVGDTTYRDTLWLKDKTEEMEYLWTERNNDGDYFEYHRYKLISSKYSTELLAEMRGGPNGDYFRATGLYGSKNVSMHYDIDPGGKFSDRGFSDTVMYYPELIVEGQHYPDAFLRMDREDLYNKRDRYPFWAFVRNRGLVYMGIGSFGQQQEIAKYYVIHYHTSQ